MCLLIGQYCFGQADIQHLPLLKSIYNIENTTMVFSESLPRKGEIMLVFYDPGCSHCQELAQEISTNLNKFTDTSIYFICMQDKAHIKGFINMFGKSLSGQPNVSFWRDPGTEFFEKFLPDNYPATYFYDAASRTLIRSLQGESTISAMF